MQQARTLAQLAEEFPSYFLNKIDRIRDRFKDVNPYQPRQPDIPQLHKFAPVTSSRLGQIIRKMPPKTCQLDLVPTIILQLILEGCLPSITHLVNSSLDQGNFCEDGKRH